MGVHCFEKKSLKYLAFKDLSHQVSLLCAASFLGAGGGGDLPPPVTKLCSLQADSQIVK